VLGREKSRPSATALCQGFYSKHANHHQKGREVDPNNQTTKPVQEVCHEQKRQLFWQNNKPQVESLSVARQYLDGTMLSGSELKQKQEGYAYDNEGI
jgi:hypothetical protein